MQHDTTDYTFIAPPRITLSLFSTILRTAQSPAQDHNDYYAICINAGLDPAIALAFFHHESTYGTKGVARETKNWGNLRAGARATTDRRIRNFGVYHSWSDSLHDWCDLMRRYVVGGRIGGVLRQPMPTVRAAIPVYAPSSDGNSPTSYANIVVSLVTQWSTAEVPIVPRGAGNYRVTVSAARVRQGPGLSFPVVRVLHHDETFIADAVVNGDAVNGETAWCHRADGLGFVHRSLVEVTRDDHSG